QPGPGQGVPAPGADRGKKHDRTGGYAMEEIKALLDKYFEAETSLAEEQRLRASFRGASVDPSLDVYRAVFGSFGEPVKANLSPDFDEQVTRRIQAPVRRLYQRGW